ncbi:M15 family metallopeptidase [Flammeovirga kamogawensis]|uniref:D-alanyl-D-alanine dipeptidase n=1 Tax=Flammeovirga kamogawensis TaxID=373891 RepID=A0ABX8GXQ5_9BACT|nr:M15 family metallopeptidase [Flammeovirga kamogawensis]MBB6462822.1 D-alanyl-D-alanine dipeptidase [Flammeovirga kamogawensis]QWG08395.1 M15 family metallopeptidase [Flammeovirga kamogawensis]TRX66690.1 M15 family metallopeptidase [Flammeovirga kamogawensis]
MRQFLFLCILIISSCKHQETNLTNSVFNDKENFLGNTEHNINKIISNDLRQSMYWKSIADLPDSSFVELNKLDSLFVLDIRYATTNNFTKTILYSCPKAMLRKVVALQLVKVQQELIKKGFKIKLFDCYRPLSVQWKMWEVYPDRRYVADPRVGSWHNKGLAVDLTICDLNGKQIEMGTPYDFFGKEAWPTYKQLPQKILKNRDLLAKTMWKFGFRPTSTEWWHYSYRHATFPISNTPFDCNDF